MLKIGMMEHPVKGRSQRRITPQGAAGSGTDSGKLPKWL